MDPRAAAAAEASVKMEESLRSMAELKEKMISRGLIPSRRPPPKRWWFQRLSKVAIARRRGEIALDRQLVKECLDYYNRQHPGNEYEPLLGNVTQNPHLHNGICWVHGTFVARKKGSGFFSFLTAPRSVFFFELAYMDGFEGVVTCTTVEEPAYSVLGYPLWWATRTSGILDSFCKTCYCRFGINALAYRRYLLVGITMWRKSVKCVIVAPLRCIRTLENLRLAITILTTPTLSQQMGNWLLSLLLLIWYL
nr:unnamed protein product [Digitaria exilis]